MFVSFEIQVIFMSIKRITYNEKEIILVGTAHVSKKSRELVAKLIEEEQPDVVGVELDKGRFEALQNEQKFQELNVIELIKSGHVWVFLLTIILKNFQRQIGSKLGEKPGSEMLAAITVAKEKKCTVALIDRDVKITMKRAFYFLTLWEKARFLSEALTSFFSSKKETEITEETIEQLKQEDILNSLLKKMAMDFPTIKRVLIDERDQYIAHKLTELKGKKILAVLGAGHVEGVSQTIGKPVDVASITSIPEKKSALKMVAYSIPLLVLGLLGYAFFTKGFAVAFDTIILWTLVTGGLAALGALLARAHPLAVLTAFLAAPITTLHPLLAAGWFSGLAQARLSLPQVKDFEGLHNLNNYRDFEQNKVTRIVLVVLYTNIGASIGTLIALPWIVSLIFK